MSTHSVNNFYVKTLAYFDAPARTIVTFPTAELLAFNVKSTSNALVEYRLSSDEAWIPFTTNAPSTHLPAQRRIQIRSDVAARAEVTLFSLMSSADDMDGGVVIAQEAAVQAESAGVSYNARSGANVDALIPTLKRNKFVSLTKPGQYLFGGPGKGGIQIFEGATFACASGVELILANSTFEPLIMAARQFDAGLAAVGAIAYGGTGANFTGTVTFAIGDLAHLKHPVGSWIAVLDLDLSNQANRSYQGIYQVMAVTPTTISYWMIDTPPSGGNSTSGARIYPVDTGIRIVGGVWDGNGPNNGQGGGNPYYQGDPHGHIISLRNVQNAIVSGLEVRRGYSWSIGTNNVRDLTVSDIYGDIYGDGLGTANAIFQGSGPGRNVLIEKIRGTCEDNMVAWSLDTIGQNRTGGTAPWTYNNHANGDVYNLRVKDVHSNKSNATIVNFWGNNNARYHSITVDGVTGRTSAGSLVGVDTGFDNTDMFNTNGGTLKVTNLSGESPASAFAMRSDGTWDIVSIDNVLQRRVGSVAGCVQFSRRTVTPPAFTVQTIKRIELSNLDARIPLSTGNRTDALVSISGTNCDDFSVKGIPVQRLNANTGIILHNGTDGVIKQMTVSEVRGEVVGAFSEACLVKCDNSGAGAIGSLVLRDCTLTGFTDGTTRGGLVHQTATGKVGRVRLDNTPIPALVRASNTVGILRDGTGMTIDVVQVTNTVAN